MTALETEGVPYVRNGKLNVMKCVMSIFICDNKGSHHLAGYFTAFHRTNRICRHCYATTDSIQNSFKETCFEQRTCDQYDSEIRHLTMENFDYDVQKIFGIKEECVTCAEQSALISLHSRIVWGWSCHTRLGTSTGQMYSKAYFQSGAAQLSDHTVSISSHWRQQTRTNS